MKLAAAVMIAGTLLSIGFWMETSRKETAKQLQELILHCASDFLLFERKMVKEQLFFDANQLSQLYEKRIMKLGNECKLCRVLSFCAAAFLLILLW